jgi:hypothetical protein
MEQNMQGNNSEIKRVSASDWDAGKYPNDQWELVRYDDFYMGKPKTAEIKPKQVKQ